MLIKINYTRSMTKSIDVSGNKENRQLGMFKTEPQEVKQKLEAFFKGPK